jgi:hypothetical protein
VRQGGGAGVRGVLAKRRNLNGWDGVCLFVFFLFHTRGKEGWQKE